MTRLIDNKERESYGDTVREIISNVTGKKDGGMSLFKN
jgi:hypothetical protein